MGAGLLKGRFDTAMSTLGMGVLKAHILFRPWSFVKRTDPFANANTNEHLAGVWSTDKGTVDIKSRPLSSSQVFPT